jgi:hypothetical protein
MTAYRQQALACAAALEHHPARPRELKAGMPDAPKILLKNVYGWFLRLERGVYTLSPTGRAALRHYAAHITRSHSPNTTAVGSAPPPTAPD